ncbi:MAG: DUF4097 domain-containing protein [Cyclobacteriaceae bacterium]|nr:DUF4097 domain-containing protein [Cyclobacteriaceae bacterium]
MKASLVTVCLFALTYWATGQEFKVTKNSGKLEVNGLNNVTIEGYGGSELVFSSRDSDKKSDDRAKGLQAINSMGLVDNTGLGISVQEKQGVVEVYQLKKMGGPEIRIQVPKGFTIHVSHQSNYGSEINLKNIENEIEANVTYASINLENVSGPLTAKSVYGHVEADFSTNLKGPISIVSVYGYADVTLPLSVKANLKMSTSYGELYAAPEFKIENERQGEMVRYDDRVTGKINGGGTDISLNSSYGKIYLRKK